MKLKIKECPEPQEKEQEVELSLEQMFDGDVALKANGVIVLWITEMGFISMNNTTEDGLREMGFRVAASEEQHSVYKDTVILS